MENAIIMAIVVVSALLICRWIWRQVKGGVQGCGGSGGGCAGGSCGDHSLKHCRQQKQ